VCGCIDVVYSLANDQVGGPPHAANDTRRMITMQRGQAAVRAILGSDPFKEPYMKRVQRALGEYADRNSVGKASVPLDLLLHILVQEWELFQSNILESIGTVLAQVQVQPQMQGFAEFAKAIRRLAPRLSLRDLAAIYHDALDRSNSDVEVSPRAFVSVVNSYRLIQRGQGTGVFVDPPGSGLIPARLDAALVEFSFEGLMHWITQDRPELLNPAAALDTVQERLGSSVEGAFAFEEAGILNSEQQTASRIVLYSLSKVRDKIASMRSQQAASITAAWQLLEEATRMWVLERQKAKITELQDNRAEAAVAKQRVADTAAGFLSSLSEVLVDCVGAGGISDMLTGPYRTKLDELRRKVQEVSDLAQTFVAPL